MRNILKQRIVKLRFMNFVYKIVNFEEIRVGCVNKKN